MTNKKPHKMEYTDGTIIWFLDGKIHREDGPAIETTDGKTFWYINDRKLTDDEIANQQFVLWCTTPVKK